MKSNSSWKNLYPTILSSARPLFTSSFSRTSLITCISAWGWSLFLCKHQGFTCSFLFFSQAFPLQVCGSADQQQTHLTFRKRTCSLAKPKNVRTLTFTSLPEEWVTNLSPTGLSHWSKEAFVQTYVSHTCKLCECVGFFFFKPNGIPKWWEILHYKDLVWLIK